jgi:hypothetical protein
VLPVRVPTWRGGDAGACVLGAGLGLRVGLGLDTGEWEVGAPLPAESCFSEPDAFRELEGAAGIDAATVDPFNPWVPARDPMPPLSPPLVAPIAARAPAAKTGAQSIAAATASARRRTG